ncbi:penicillin-binding protein 2 [Paenibacillus sp. TRM 82003]|nr:penicillin-binding protein 2 [Paenibacillus sp. TRM 82003]
MNRIMHGDDPQRNEIAKRRQFTFRINVFFFCVFVLFSVLIVRLAFIQFVQGNSLSEEESNRSTRTVAIAPIRGHIFDRNNYPIAYSSSTQSVYYRMEPGKKHEDHLAIAKRLQELFVKYGEYDEGKIPTLEQVYDAMDVGYEVDGTRTSMFNRTSDLRRVKSGLTQKEIAVLMTHPETFPGIEVVEESVRHYDPNTIAVQLIGYLQPFTSSYNRPAEYLNFYKDPEKTGDYLRTEEVGFDGLEFLYQETLRGQSGARKYPINSQGQIVGEVTTTPPTKGNNIHLTIDKDVQLTAEQTITDHLEVMKKSTLKYQAMGKNALAGYAVAMEVDTGNVVAMASMPDYDSNEWAGGISPEKFNEILPYYNNGTIRTVYANVKDEKDRGKYPSSIVPLGSTLKPLTVLIGLNEGFYSPTDRYNDTGRYYFGRNDAASIGNAEGHVYGRINPADAIRVSSNTFMAAWVGEKLYEKYGGENGGPIEVWDDYMKKFGLGVSTGSGLPMESAGVIDYTSDTRGSVQSALVMGSFGQQGRYTTLQLAQYTAMLANKGKRMKPNFVDRITDFEGHLVDEIEPVVLNEETFDPKHWETVHSGMKQVTKNSVLTQWFGHLPFEVSSKTGTSQQDTAAGKIENSVFIAYAPADNPKLAVAVVVPWGGYGSWGAAPIAAKIFEAYDQYVGFNQ